GGRPDKAQDIATLYPSVFERAGEGWRLVGAPTSAPSRPVVERIARETETARVTGASTGDRVTQAVTTTAISGASSVAGSVAGGLTRSVASQVPVLGSSL